MLHILSTIKKKLDNISAPYLKFYFNSINIFFICYITACNANDDVKYKLFDFLLYGDFSYKSTNFSKKDYDAVSGWAEERLVLTLVRYDEEERELITPANRFMDNNIFKFFTPNPYLKFTESASSAAGFTSFDTSGYPYHFKDRIPYENTFVWGGGLENRLIERLDEMFLNRRIGENKYLDWFRSYRLYAEYLHLEYLTDQWWQSDYDFRTGVDLWYEWNVPGGAGRGNFSKSSLNNLFSGTESMENFRDKKAFLWGELYQDLNYKKTNFYIGDYESIVFNTSGKLGIRLFDYPGDWNQGSKWSVHIMPYSKTEVEIGERNFFWENTFKAGVGLRVMPRIKITKKSELFLRIYGEYLNVVNYFKDNPTDNIPWSDYTFGINFSLNRH